MSVRITTTMSSNAFFANLDKGNAKVSRWEQQLATNRKIVDISENPLGVLQTIQARQRLSKYEKYQSNVAAASSWVDMSETSMNQMNTLLKDIYELVEQAATDTTNDENKGNIATTISGKIDNLMDIANSVLGEQYIFSGHSTSKKPFDRVTDPDGTTHVTYNGLNLGTILDDPNGLSGVFRPTMSGAGASVFGMGQPQWFYGEINGQFYEGWIGAVAADTATIGGLAPGGDADLAETIRIWHDDGNYSDYSRPNVKAVQYDPLDPLSPYPVPSGPDAGTWELTGNCTLTSDSQPSHPNHPYVGWVFVPGGTALPTTPGDSLEVNNTGTMLMYGLHFPDTEQEGVCPLKFDFPVTVTYVSDPTNPDGSPATVITSELTWKELLEWETGQHIQFDTSVLQTTQVSVNGIELVGVGEDYMFDKLDGIVKMLNDGASAEELTKQLTVMQKLMDRTTSNAVVTGGQTQILDTMKNRYSQDVITAKEIKKNVEEIDQADTIMNMKLAEQVYQQAMYVGVSILQLSLIDFLN